MSGIPPSYDQVPYPGYPFPETHPDRLATLARICGLTPAPVERSRVLEIACGDGMNLIPMAYAMPECRFTGFDLSGRAIAAGRGALEALGLSNISLHHMDLTGLPVEWGEFDYIIAHGLYSWVPHAVRDALLAACRRHLAPNGVAYVSYNCLPGGYIRRMVREMLQFHLRSYAGAQEILTQARALGRLLEDSRQHLNPGNTFLGRQLEHLLGADDGVIFHDYLAEVNHPVYFHEFAAHAAQHGLQFLAEADFYEMQPDMLAPKVAEVLGQIPERQHVLVEQYLDFVKCRSFRMTLLCHEHLRPNWTFPPERARHFLISGRVKPASENPQLHTETFEEFHGPLSSRASASLPVAKAALVVLGRSWPLRLPFQHLFREVQNCLSAAGPLPESASGLRGETLLAECLMKFFKAGLLGFHTFAPQLAVQVSEKPESSRVARWQALAGDVVTSLNHDSARLEDPLSRKLLRLCDGTRDLPAILKELESAAGALPAEQRPQVSMTRLEEKLRDLARLALLIA
jgi:SAM-dependent methyltransferase